MFLKVGGLSCTSLEGFGERSLVHCWPKLAKVKGRQERRFISRASSLYVWMGHTYMCVHGVTRVEGKWGVIPLKQSYLVQCSWRDALLFGAPWRRVRDVDMKHNFAFVVSVLPSFPSCKLEAPVHSVLVSFLHWLLRNIGRCLVGPFYLSCSHGFWYASFRLVICTFSLM